jgi:hypothetical protein
MRRVRHVRLTDVLEATPASGETTALAQRLRSVQAIPAGKEGRMLTLYDDVFSPYARKVRLWWSTSRRASRRSSSTSPRLPGNVACSQVLTMLP